MLDPDLEEEKEKEGDETEKPMDQEVREEYQQRAGDDYQQRVEEEHHQKVREDHRHQLRAEEDHQHQQKIAEEHQQKDREDHQHQLRAEDDHQQKIAEEHQQMVREDHQHQLRAEDDHQHQQKVAEEHQQKDREDTEIAQEPDEEYTNSGSIQNIDDDDVTVPQTLKICHVLIKNCSVACANTLVEKSSTDDVESQLLTEVDVNKQKDFDPGPDKQVISSCSGDKGRQFSTDTQQTSNTQEDEDHLEDGSREDFNRPGNIEDTSPDQSQVLSTRNRGEIGKPQNIVSHSDLDEEKAENEHLENSRMEGNGFHEMDTEGNGSHEMDAAADIDLHKGRSINPQQPGLDEKRLDGNDINNKSSEKDDGSQDRNIDEDPSRAREEQQKGSFEAEHSRYEPEQINPDEERGSNHQRLSYQSERYDQGNKYGHELHHSQRQGFVENMGNRGERDKYEINEQIRYDRHHELDQMQKAQYAQECQQHLQGERYDHGHRVDDRHYVNSARNEHKDEPRYGHGTPMKTEPVYDQQDPRNCYEAKYDNDQKQVGLNPSLGFKHEAGHSQVPFVKQEVGNAHKVQVKQESLQPPATPVKRGPGRPRNGSRPEGYVPPIKVKVEPKETVFEIMNNLEQIFKGAFLQDSEEEDAVEDENFITVQVKTKNNHKASICFRREVLHLPVIKSVMGPRVGRPPKLRDASGMPLPPVPSKKPRIFANWLKCHQCEYKCRKRQPLQSHLLEEHNEIIYLCQHCEEIFKDKDILLDHERKVHGGVKFPCPENDCNFASTVVPELEEHARKHISIMEPCPNCDHKADNVTDLNTHTESHHPGEKLFCEHCSSSVSNSESLREHLVHNHHQQPIPTSCSKCEFASNISKLLKSHEANFHKTVEYKCSQCSFVCSWESSLQSHYVKCHGAKEFECDYCDFTCRWKTGFNKHMREKHTESGKLQTQCNHCGIQFTCRRDLKRHIKENHEKPIEFNCSYCGKNFPKKPNLKIHERIHTGEKPYKCETCGHAFTAASNLYHHKKKHLKEASNPKPKQEPKAVSSSVHAVYEQQGYHQQAAQSYRHDSTESSAEHNNGGHMEPKMESGHHHQESPGSKGETGGGGAGGYPDPQYLASFPQYYGSGGYANPASYSYPSPGAGEQYGRPSSGGGGGGGGSGGGGGGEEGGASSNYRRIFTEEQYRMLAQQEEEYRKRSLEEQYRKFSSTSSSSIEEQYRKFATEEHYRKLATEEQYRRLASAAASKIDRGGLWMPALH